MSQKKSYITVKDLFCGAGGNTEGIKQYARRARIDTGIQVTMAVNHWELAIDTHNTNHPETDHDCANISESTPRRYPTTDVLVASPECTNQTNANGKKKQRRLDLFNKIDPEAERSRATMWDVPRFAEYHSYNLILVENVVEARSWIMWEAWLKAMHLLGYNHKCVYLNSMHAHPTPQSRDRMYVVFWKKGNKAPDLEVRPRGYCTQCAKDTETFQWWKNSERAFGKYKTQYLFRCPTCNNVVDPYYYSAFNCIDWSNPGVRIGEREQHGLKPLCKNTLARIEYGRNKYWNEPSLINIRYSSGLDCRIKSSKDPLQTQTGDNNIGLLNPLLLNGEYNSEKKVRDMMVEPKQTQTGWQTDGIVFPFIIKNYGGDPQKPITINETLGAVTGADHHGLFRPPLIIENFGKSNARPATERLGCVATEPKYGLLTDQAWNSFLSYYYSGSDMASHVASEATRTFNGNDRASLITGGNKPKIEDCFYRMLVAPEVQRAMAFRDDYIVKGNSRQKVKQLGNAVTPPAMEWLFEQGIETLL